jgi:hypothetical protein
MFDQVLVWPFLVPAFPLEQLKLPERIGPVELLNKSFRPDKRIGSDDEKIGDT